MSAPFFVFSFFQNLWFISKIKKICLNSICLDIIVNSEIFFDFSVFITIRDFINLKLSSKIMWESKNKFIQLYLSHNLKAINKIYFSWNLDMLTILDCSALAHKQFQYKLIIIGTNYFFVVLIKTNLS